MEINKKTKILLFDALNKLDNDVLEEVFKMTKSILELRIDMKKVINEYLIKK